MIKRALRDRVGQAVALGLVAVLVVGVGLVLDSWRVVALGLAVALAVVLLLLGLALVTLRRVEVAASRRAEVAGKSDKKRTADKKSTGDKRPTADKKQTGAATGVAAPKPAPAPLPLAPVATGAPAASSMSILDELALTRVIDDAVVRLGLAADVARRVAADRGIDRREQADLLRLVTRHDTSPSLPVDTAVPAHAVMAAVTNILERRPARVLAVGPGVAALWLARAVTEGGGRLDIAADPTEVETLTELVAHRGLSDGVGILPCPTREIDETAVVRPWVDLSAVADRYDLVVVLPADAADARAAVPALGTVVDRLVPAGEILVAGPEGAGQLGRAWAARHEVEVVGEQPHAAVSGRADAHITRDDAILLRAVEPAGRVETTEGPR